MYMTYVLPFTSKMQNAGAMVSELGMVVIHGSLFPLLKDDDNMGLSHYTQSAFFFFVTVTITVAILAVLIIIDSFTHIKKVMTLCSKEPVDDKPQKILDSYSSDSLTEREVSFDDEDEKNDVKYELYNPEKDQEKFVLAEKKRKKEEAKKKKGYRPPTPTKKGDPLVSNFGRPMFKDTQDVGEDTEEDVYEDDNSEVSEKPEYPDFRPPAPPQNDPMEQTTASMMAKPITPVKALTPAEEAKERLFMQRDETNEPTPQRFYDPNAPKPQTPTKVDPSMTGGFESGYKSASALNPNDMRR